MSIRKKLLLGLIVGLFILLLVELQTHSTLRATSHHVEVMERASYQRGAALELRPTVQRTVATFSIPLLIAAVVLVVLATIAWRRRPVAGATASAVLMLATAVWALGYALELVAEGLQAKLFWTKVQYLGIVVVPGAWLALALQVTGRQKWLGRRSLALLAAEPLVILFLVWTNERHNLIWVRNELDLRGPIPTLVSDYGVAFWAHVVYSYALLLVGTALFLQTFLRSPPLYRRQAGAILLGVLVLWVGNVLYLTNWPPLHHLDLIPFAFALTGLLVAWGLFRLRMLDIVPVAHDAVVDGMGDGVIVLDAQNRIVDINPAAERIIGHPAAELIGQPVAQVLSGRRELVERYLDVLEAQTEITLGKGEDQRFYELRISPLHDRRGRLTGRVILLHDITERKRSEESLRQRFDQLQAIYQLSEAVGRARTLEEICEQALDGLRSTLSPDRAAVLLFDPDGVMRFKAWRGLSEEYRKAVEGHSPWASGEKEPRPVLVPDVETDQELAALRPVIRREGIRAVGFIPLVYDGYLLGKFMLCYERPHSFTPEEIQLAETIARHIALAIGRQHAQEALHRREAILKAVSFAAEEFLKATSWEENIAEILARLGRAADVSRVYIFENHVGPEGDELLTSQRYEWAAPGIEPQLENPELQNFPYHAGGFSRWVELLGRGGLVYGHVREFPESEREVLSAQDIRSIAVVPIFVEQTWWGFIGFDECTAEREWSEMELDALRAAASTLGAAIQRQRMEEESSAQQRYLALLNDITLAAVEATDLRTMLQVLADRMAELLDADGCYITLWDEERRQPIPAAAYGPLRETYPTIQVQPGETTMTESVLRAGRPLVAEDVFNTPYLSPRIAALFPARSLLGLPLIADGQKLGAALIAFNEPHRFTPEEIARGEQAARQIALAVAKARLLETEREQRQLAEALREASAALTTTLDFEAVLDRLLDQIARVVPYDAANVMLVEGSCARVVRMRGYEQFGKEAAQEVERLSFEVSSTPNLRHMAETGQPLVVPDTAADPGWIQVKALDHLRSWAGAPIIVQGEVVAFFSLDKVEPGFYHQEHAERLAAFAGHAALALENARLFEAERRRAAHQKALNAIITAAASASELPDLLETVLHHALQALELEMGAIWVADRLALRGLPPEIGPASLRVAQAADLDIPGPIAIEDWQSTAIDHPWSAVAPVMIRFGVRASLVVPVLAKGERIGGLAVVAPHPRTWSAEEIALVETIGRQLGAAAERLLLFQETRTHATEMARLAALSEALNRPFTVAEVIEAIGQGALTLSNANRAAVYVRQPDDTVTCPWFRGLSPEYVTQVAARVREMPGGRLVESSQPVLIPDVGEVPEDSPLREMAAAEGYRAVGLWPLVYEGQVVAAVGCYYDAPHSWSEVEHEVMEAFCRQAAVALENARLFEAVQRRAQEAETLREVGAVVAATLDLDETIQRILEQLEQVVPYDSASVQLLREGYVEIVGGRGWPDPAAVVGLRFPVPGDNPNTVVIQERRPYILGDAPAAHSPFREEPHSHIRSWLGVPLIVGDRVIGMLTVDSAEPHHFTAEHARLAAAFADQVAIALENARLFQAEQRRREVVATLLEIAEVAGSSLELTQVLKYIAQHTARVCQAKRCSIFLLDESGEYLQPVMSQFADGHVEPELWQLFKTTGADRLDAVPLFRSAIRERRPALLEDPDRTDLLPRRWTQPYDIQKLLVVPLIAHDRVIGLMALDHTDPRREFTSEQIELALTIGGRVAASVENARLYAAERKRARQLEALHQATTTLLATLERETLLDRILGGALHIIPAAEKGMLLLVDGETGRLRVRAIHGYEDPRVRTFAATFAASEGHAARAVRQGKPLLIDDTVIHPALHHDGDIAEVRAIRSALVVPLLLEDQAIGALSLEATRPAAFTEDDLRLLTTFGATAATAIRNAQLHAEVQELATTDPLTGLYNRRAFFEMGRREVERARRFGRPLTAIMFDLDHFKRVNDTYGHAIGDQVLAGLARLCQEELREVDLLGRYGGEEFVVLLPETSVAGAWQVAERLRRRIERAEIETDRGPMRITLSLGIAALDAGSGDLETLLERADRAMYAAKQAGRNRVRMWGRST